MADAARGSVIRGEWSSPEGVRLILADYAARWIRERQLQQPRTRELYESKLWNHINPYLGSRALDKINAQTIRTWRQCLLDEGRSPNRGSKVVPALSSGAQHRAQGGSADRRESAPYRRVRQEETAEPPVGLGFGCGPASELIDTRYRGLVLLAALTGLRWGELTALRACDFDLDRGTVRVARKFAELQNGQREAGPPKSAAGVRTIAIPAALIQVTGEHLAEYPASGEDLIIRGPLGAALRRNNFHRSVDWSKLVTDAGLPASTSTMCCIPTTFWRPPPVPARGTDAPDGPRQQAGGAHLPARHERT